MKLNQLPVFLFLFISVIGCGNKKDFDSSGRLLAQYLSSDEGSMNLNPMSQRDSLSNGNFVPVVYKYKGEPYNGSIAHYDDDGTLIFEGNLIDGMANGAWKFYYPSGVLRMEGNFVNGFETGFWYNYYTVDKLKIVMLYDEYGYLLMRKEFYDSGRIKNYQNIKCTQFGDRERRIEFTYDGNVDYIDAERSLGSMPASKLHDVLLNDSLLVKHV
jgi:hypothetical protein